VNVPAEAGETVSLPLAVLLPAQAPLALQLRAFDDQVSVALSPSVIVVGSTAIESVAGGRLPPSPP
jgi:hypothetical protein